VLMICPWAPGSSWSENCSSSAGAERAKAVGAGFGLLDVGTLQKGTGIAGEEGAFRFIADTAIQASSDTKGCWQESTSVLDQLARKSQ